MTDDAMGLADQFGFVVRRDPLEDLVAGLDDALGVGRREEQLVEPELRSCSTNATVRSSAAQAETLGLVDHLRAKASRRERAS